jgi:CubicO group peptidase (beta-lactamase class C family)
MKNVLISLLVMCNATLFAAFDEYVKEVLETFHVSEAAVAVGSGDRVLLCSGYGEKVDEHTLFSIGSCTKAFTAHLIEEVADFDDLVIKHLPDFRLYDQELTLKVSLRDLLAHRTGVRRNDTLWVMHNLSRKDVMNFLPLLDPAYGLRENFEYNNYMYTVLGMVVEKCTGKSWEQVVAERIFKPLQMHDSVTRDELACINPGAGIYSSISDMTKWLQFHLAQDRPEHKLSMPFMHSCTEGAALGWLVTKYCDRTCISHTGLVEGFCSEVAFLPKEKIGIVILTNNSSSGSFAIAAIKNAIFNKLLDLPDDYAFAMQKARYMSSQKMLSDSLDEFQRLPQAHGNQYVGEYENPLYGKAAITVDKEGFLLLHYANEVLPLRQKSEDVCAANMPQLRVFGINPIVDCTWKEGRLLIPFEGFRGSPPIIFNRSY